MQPGNFDALTADSLEEFQGGESFDFPPCSQTFNFREQLILSRAEDFGRVHKLSSGMPKTVGGTVVEKADKPIFCTVV